MEIPTNPSADAIRPDISPTDPSLSSSLGGDDRKQSAVTASSEERQAASGENQPRPLRFRYSLIGSLKRPKTIGVDCMGPARRVLLPNTGKSDESLPKPTKEDNNAIEKLFPLEERHMTTRAEDAACTEILSPEQGEASSSPSQSSGSGQVAGRNCELPEQRKRKADIYAMTEGTSITLTVNMESIGSPSQNNGDSRLAQQGCDLFGRGGFDLGENFQRFMGEHNLSVNSYSVYDKEVKQPSAKGSVEAAAPLKYEPKQMQELYDASGRSELSKPPLLDGPKKVHFAIVPPSGRGESTDFPNSCIMDTRHKQCQPEFVPKQLPSRSVGLLKHAIEAKSMFSSSFRRDNCTQSKPHLKPAQVDRVLDSVSSTPLVSVYVGANEKVETDPGVDNLSSHMSSLLLTENQGSESLGNLGESFACHQQNLKLAGLHSEPKSEVRTSKDRIATRSTLGESSGNFRSLDPHSGACDLAMHLRPDTSSSSAPSASVLPCTTSAFAGQSATSIRWTSAPLASLSAGLGLNVSREQSSSVKENGVGYLNGEPSNARLQEPRVVPKPIEDGVPQEPHVVAKAIEDRGQPPEVASNFNKVVLQPSSRSNSEKGASCKETGVHRKKHYDPDAFFRVNNKIYQRLGKIGSGGSSEVHKVISADCTIYALKKIKLKGRDYSTAYGFCQEIDYLKRLQGKNYIIQLIDYEVTDKSLFSDVIRGDKKIKDGKIDEDAYIYMVLEYGEIDLAQMLLQKWKEMDSGNKQIDENWLRFYWQQILKAVNTIHEERIVHSDLKPANFLLVKGVLKLIDFGIAKAIQSDTTNIQRDSQVGTLNYMSPEAFMCNDQDENGNTIKCGRSSDIWSLGCILYQMVYGRTPFAEFTTFWAKYKEITNKDHKITYGPVSNPWLLDIMKKCLTWNRNERLRIPQLLEHPFLCPPLSPPLLTQKEQHCKALFEISKIYGSVAEIHNLCDKLLEHLTKQ